MVVGSALNVASLDELAQFSKSKPGTLSYGSARHSDADHDRELEEENRWDLVYVPVRGGGDMVNGLLTGTTPVAIVGLPNFIPFIRSGTVKALAIDSEARSALFP